MPSFGALLRELRKSAGLSQTVLAQDLGWSQSKVSYLEGLEEVPKEEDVGAVCRRFGIGPDYFYERRADRAPRALEYLVSLAKSPPEESPKTAIAFYSQMHRLTKEQQASVADVLKKHIEAKRSRPRK